jgi:CubicO group peptidase (beta-lactamase class C family)
VSAQKIPEGTVTVLFIDLVESTQLNQAPGVADRVGPYQVMSFNDPLWAGSDDGSSGVHASAPDLARFWQMCLDGGVVGDTRVLSADAVRVMTTNQIPGIAVDLDGWIDPETGVVAVYIELVTEDSDDGMPWSWASHRFQDVVNAAVLG